MKNKWIADRGYGTGMALAFQGDAEFIRTSVNFAVNYLLSARAQIKEQTPSFIIINTTTDELMKAFALEGYCLKMRELWAKVPPLELEDDDLPEDFEQRVDTFIRKTLLDDPTAVDPTASMYVETPEMIAEAEAAGIEHAKKEFAKIEFEDFMRRVSRAGLREHAMSESS